MRNNKILRKLIKFLQIFFEMIFAISHAVLLPMSVRLWYLPDIILEQLAVFGNVQKPNREDIHKEGRFLIFVAD